MSTALRSAGWVHAAAVFRRFVLSSANFPQQCVLGIRDPQSEIDVWLEGIGTPLDVTRNNVLAAARPLTIGVGLGSHHQRAEIRRCRPLLRFTEMGGERRRLGEIRLRMTGTIPLGDEQLCLFETRGSRNHCVPKASLWIRYLDHAYRQWRSERRSGVPALRMRTSELHSVFTFYICPRPVALVSVVHGRAGNIFPMDLIGPVGTRHFALALNNTSAPLRLIEQSRILAVSSVPLEHSSLVFELARNHKAPAVDFGSLPFATTASTVFGLPVPRFSLRTREMQIDTMQRLGSHTMLIARTVTDVSQQEGLQMFQAHGSYQVWRQKQGLSART